MKQSCLSGILGLAVGDALGVPVEFLSRSRLKENPVTSMRGFGTWDKPAGTWSDDTSLTLATLDSLAGGIDPEDCMNKFAAWFHEGKYTPDGDMFDVGNTTCSAIQNHRPGTTERDNGNGSLMRILPAVYAAYAKYGSDAVKTPAAFDLIHTYSALTHAHPISKMTCGIYACVAVKLLDGEDKVWAVEEGASAAARYYHENPEFRPWYQYFTRIFNRILGNIGEVGIRSGGFAVDTLEAALWVLLTQESFEATVLHAVNLGEDTDTTAAVAGGLAGILYGAEAIPKEWKAGLLGREELEALCRTFDEKWF
ncbi:MAG TPA: ADP-ribosylglycohydrolase family protein [Methanocorpusculum sp.]|nr:ADP-ribosylglycohydrolase family protein [Methanocorpusculum sp.]